MKPNIPLSSLRAAADPATESNDATASSSPTTTLPTSFADIDRTLLPSLGPLHRDLRELTHNPLPDSETPGLSAVGGARSLHADSIYPVDGFEDVPSLHPHFSSSPTASSTQPDSVTADSPHAHGYQLVLDLDNSHRTDRPLGETLIVTAP